MLRCVRQNLRDGIGVFSPFCMGRGEGVASCFKQGRCVKMRKTELEGWYRCFQSFLHGGGGLIAALNKVDVLRCVRQNLRDGIGVFSPFCMGGGGGG